MWRSIKWRTFYAEQVENGSKLKMGTNSPFKYICIHPLLRNPSLKPREKHLEVSVCTSNIWNKLSICALYFPMNFVPAIPCQLCVLLFYRLCRKEGCLYLGWKARDNLYPLRKYQIKKAATQTKQGNNLQQYITIISPEFSCYYPHVLVDLPQRKRWKGTRRIVLSKKKSYCLLIRPTNRRVDVTFLGQLLMVFNLAEKKSVSLFLSPSLAIRLDEKAALSPSIFFSTENRQDWNQTL